MAGTALLSQPALASAPRRLALVNLHTGETLKATFWEGGAYVPDALAAIDKVLRDHRTGDVHPIAPGLLDLLALLRQKVNAAGVVQVISGYRSPHSNAALRKTSAGVASRSLHMDGKAMDIRIQGVPSPALRDAAWALQGGGVGYYAASDFVHIDIGRPRRWTG